MSEYPSSKAWLLSSCAIGCAVTGCGGPSGSGKPSGDTPASDAGDASAVRVLDCAWLTGTDNCFRAPLAAAAQNCAIPSSDGMLSADGTECTFSSGAVVTFATPLTSSAMIPDFSVYPDGGGACLSGGFPTDGVFITTAAGTTTVASDPSTQTVTLTCPDGTIYAGSFTSLSGCGGAFPGLSIASGGAGGPADGGTTGPIVIAIAIAGGGIGMTKDAPIFGCSSP